MNEINKTDFKYYCKQGRGREEWGGSFMYSSVNNKIFLLSIRLRYWYPYRYNEIGARIGIIPLDFLDISVFFFAKFQP